MVDNLKLLGIGIGLAAAIVLLAKVSVKPACTEGTTRYKECVAGTIQQTCVGGVWTPPCPEDYELEIIVTE